MLRTIRKLCALHSIKWSIHAASQMQARNIFRQDVLDILQSGEIIEDYPNDFPHPSCLLCGKTRLQQFIHVVVGTDGENLFIITAYYPSPEKFTDAFSVRR